MRIEKKGHHGGDPEKNCSALRLVADGWRDTKKLARLGRGFDEVAARVAAGDDELLDDVAEALEAVLEARKAADVPAPC